MNFVTCNMKNSFGGILNVKFMDNHPSRAKKKVEQSMSYTVEVFIQRLTRSLHLSLDVSVNG